MNNMKNIKDLIYESQSSQLIDYIINQLNTVDINVLEKIKSLLDKEGLDNELVDKFFKKKGLSDCQDLILSIFHDCGDIQCLSKQIYEPIQISSSDLLNHNNIYDLLSPFVKQKTLQKLANYRPAKNTIARGPYEVVLDLFLSDINDGNVGRADVNTNNLGEIELKGPKARIKGSLKPAPENCTNVFNNLMNEHHIDIKESNIFQNSSYIKNITLKLFNEYNLSESQICEIMAKSILGKYIYQNTTSIENDLVEFLKKHSKTLFNKSKYAKIIFTAFLITDMYFYHDSEKWDYIMIFKGTSLEKGKGDYILIDGNEVSKGIDAIYKLFDKYNIYTSSSGIHDKDSFSQACQIVVK